MVIFKSEKIKSSFDGTIIDIETIGEFCREYQDSREYKDLVPTIFGYINKDGLKIYYIGNGNSVEKLRKNIIKILPELERPFYAFNCKFEAGVLFHAWDIELLFENELNEWGGEWKGDAVKKLKIDNYDDPFFDVGKKCKEAWERGEFKECISHNRSCLLKERDIMFKRGYRKPDDLILYRK